MNHSIGRFIKIVLGKLEIGLACGLIALILAGCNLIFPLQPPTATQKPIVSVDELRFNDPMTGQRFRTLDGCIQNLVDGSWQTSSYQLVGNFYTSKWCHGAGSHSDCQIAYATQDNRDQHTIELNTLFYDQTYPEVFGLGLQALWVPKTTGWGALFSIAENGEGVVGDGWGVIFHEYSTSSGPPDASVELAWKVSYTIYGPNRTTFEQRSDLPLRADLAQYLNSAEAMRDRGLAQIQALAMKVAAAINTHQVNTCDLGPYLGKGVPPACTLRPLTASEEATELGRAKAYFDNQEQLLNDHYQQMYAAWMAAFPLDQCWP